MHTTNAVYRTIHDMPLITHTHTHMYAQLSLTIMPICPPPPPHLQHTHTHHHHYDAGHHVSRHFRDYLPLAFVNHADFVGDPKSAIPEVVLTEEQVLIQKDDVDTDLSGTTCVMALIRGRDVTCFNIGDSRCVVGKLVEGGDGKLVAEDISQDHKPDDPEEKVRIEGNGGRVETRIYDDGYVGPARVYLQFAQVPGLAMSRSLCDTVAKEAGVISEPEITEFKLEQDIKVMILASDGLWEFMSSQEVMDIVSKRMTEGTAPHEVRVNTIDVAAGRWRWRCCGGACGGAVVVRCRDVDGRCMGASRGACVCACGM